MRGEKEMERGRTFQRKRQERSLMSSSLVAVSRLHVLPSAHTQQRGSLRPAVMLTFEKIFLRWPKRSNWRQWRVTTAVSNMVDRTERTVTTTLALFWTSCPS
ncbi:hypothetical protein AMECASPLE_012235 [Ameca splendens]|uniref:Uncharacterized protein n=1 Tax=Ameca splendens TaxID=208324 RepID=A0ABV0YZN5_9TELE